LLSNQDAAAYSSDILLMKGIYYTKRNIPDSAEQTFNKIMRDDYTYLQAYIEKGLLYFDQKKYAKALEVFTLSTEVKNDFADGYFWMAKTFLKLNNKEYAVLNFKKSLALDPSITEAREELKSLGAIQ
jgi:tetratricopeptide (TPR) repeat protein